MQSEGIVSALELVVEESIVNMQQNLVTRAEQSKVSASALGPTVVSRGRLTSLLATRSTTTHKRYATLAIKANIQSGA